MPPQRPKRPPESRAELFMAIMDQKERLLWSDEEFLARLFTFFTNVDMKMILEELRKEKPHSRMGGL